MRVDGTKVNSLSGFQGIRATASTVSQILEPSQAAAAVTNVLTPALTALSDSRVHSIAEGYVSQLRSQATAINALDPCAQDYATTFAADLATYNQALARFTAWNGTLSNNPLQVDATTEVPTTPTLKTPPTNCPSGPSGASGASGASGSTGSTG